MKYITTSTHPELKEGVKFIQSNSRKDMFVSRTLLLTYIATFDVDELLEKGFIKEVQKREFTKDDMIEFIGFRMDVFYTKEQGDILLDSWLKQRNNEK